MYILIFTLNILTPMFIYKYTKLEYIEQFLYLRPSNLIDQLTMMASF